MFTFLVFGWGGQKGNEVVVSRVRLRSLEDTLVYVKKKIIDSFTALILFYSYSGRCDTSTTISAYTSQVVLLNRLDCHD